MNLPIFELKDAICHVLSDEARLIIEAPTGSGKSTQVPQMLCDSGLFAQQQIIILQPRRLAARLLATRVAQERQSPLGQEVGYQVRFEEASSKQTRIKYVTEGILLRQMLSSPTLDGVSVLIFDEFHERHLYGDVTLARALQLQKTLRPDLKIVVMSATLDVASLEQYLAPCQILQAQGRTYPVTVQYLEQNVDYKKTAVWDLALQAFENSSAKYPSGDVLIFMPGSYEIQRTLQALQGRSCTKNCVLLPLHGELSVADQNAALKKYSQRKIIVSTNVAETSVTIDGVQLVIDSGLARIARFDPHRGINTLLIEKISQASVDQRKGRAGRTAEGHCVRLWSEHDHSMRMLQELPEIKRLDLAEVVLTLKANGITDIANFPWLEAPEPIALKRAEQLLYDLGAIESINGSLTELGKTMLFFPLHPRYGRMLLEADSLKCVPSIALIAALTQGRSFFLRGQSSYVETKREEVFGKETLSDFILWMKAWQYARAHNYNLEACKQVGIHAFAAEQVGLLYQHFLQIAQKQRLCLEESFSAAAVQQCVLVGFVDQLACRADVSSPRCRLIHGRTGILSDETSVRKHKLFVAAEVREVDGKERSVILSAITAVEITDLQKLFPSFFQSKQVVQYDSSLKKVTAVEQMCFADLVLQEHKLTSPPLEPAAELLAEQIAKGNLNLVHWNHAIEQWIVRVNCLAKWCPELNIASITDDDRKMMLQQICLGATTFAQVKEREIASVVHSWLDYAQARDLECYVPTTYLLPSQKRVKIVYSDTDLPQIACRIQELYGLENKISVAKGRVPIVVQVLAPNQRPVQVTQDMASFWRDTYPKVKQELQRKYPKHKWL